MEHSLIFDLSRSLLKHLDSSGANKSSEELLEEVNALPGDEERVAFIKTLLKNFQPPELMFENSKDSKSVESIYFASVKRSIETHDMEFALAKLSKGLARIPKDQSELLFQALSLRSDILLCMRQFSACANDVRVALTLTLDAGEGEKLKYKLDLCHKYLEKVNDLSEANAGDMEQEFGDPMNTNRAFESVQKLTLTAVNPLVPCASDALKLVDDAKTKIRHFVAAREIKPGEVLIVEEPLVSHLNPECLDRCSCCMQTSFNLDPCDTCRWDMYCSAQCKEEAKKVHCKECALMPTLLSGGAESNVLNLLKLVLDLDLNTICEAKKDPELGVSKPLLSSDLNSLFLLRPCEIEDKSMLVLFFTFWAKLLGFDDQSPDFDRLVVAMGRLLPVVSAASFSIDQVVLTGGYLGEDSHGGIGLGVFPVTALVAHSCSPNSMAFNVGRHLILQATRVIAPGSKITQCLYPEADFLKVERLLRQSRMQDSCFQSSSLAECNCEACIHDWPVLDKLDGCDPKDLEVNMLVESPLTTDLLPNALSKAEEMEQLGQKHTREFHLLQEQIRMTLARQGNVCRLRPRSSLVTLSNIFVD
ncbi:uncharacterized protein LOC132201618 [Neocloeon triangulifer]|uniref:uncharacterized protein LOC132201618 n=1 Tax=Neocloeon triangulifer TaxID=2078957 RepID=UPI00286EF7C3|nr:uncharacterized protein LOC132201618 [Neocloeon triangulifer]